MSNKNYITVRDFKIKCGIPSDEKRLARAATQAIRSSWRGIKLEKRWNADGTEYVCPENVLKKMARALRIPICDTIQGKSMMTTREFRNICPGLSKTFSANINDYCCRHGMTVEGTRQNRRYPYEVLQRYAQKEGKQVPDLPRQSGAELPKMDKQGELPLRNPAEGGNSEYETQPLLVGILDALNERNRIARENGAKLDARLDKLETKLDKLISSSVELLAIWKGDKA